MSAPIAAPVLNSVDPVRVVPFLKKGERHVIEVSAKQAEVASLKSHRYTASIDRIMLKLLRFVGKFDSLLLHDATDKDLTDTYIQTFVE